MKRVLGTALILAAGMAFAQYDAEDGYVRMKQSDKYYGTSSTSWNQVGNWELAEFTAATNYYVPAKMYLWAGNAAKDWKGGPVVFAGQLLARNSSGGMSNLPGFADVTFLGGSEIFEIMNTGGLRDSNAKILASKDNPFLVRSSAAADGSYTGTIYFPGTVFAGDAETGVRLFVEAGKKSAGFYLDACNFADYLGTVTADGSDVTVLPRGDQGGLAFGGSFVVNGATVKAAMSASDWTAYPTMPVGSLVLQNGGTFNMWQKDGAVRPVLDVTKRLEMDETGKISLGNFDWKMFNVATPEAESANRMLIAHLAADATTEGVPTEGEIADLWQNAGAASLMRNWRYEIVDGDNAGKDLYAVYTNNVVGTLKADTRSSSGNPADTAFGTPTPADYWSDGQMPSSESTADYLIRYRFYPFSDIILPKASVTILADNSLDCIGDGNLFRIRELNFVDSGTFGRWSGDSSKQTARFEGGVINLIGSAAQSFQVSHGRAFLFFSRLTGTKTLRLSNRDITSEKEFHGSISLSADNSDFHGQLVFANLTPATAADEKRFSTRIGDVRHWGGTYAGSDDPARAIVLQNDLIVYVTNDVAFAATDRSICVTDGVRFDVSKDKTFTLANQLTVTGRILKLGAGTLDLSGTLVLPEAETAASLQVSAGALKTGSATACEGLDVSFAEGTKLVVRSDVGYVNTTAANPLAINTTDGKLPVIIEYVGEEVPESLVVTVATVSKAVGANLSVDDFKLTLLKDGETMSGLKRPVRFVKVEDEATCSFVATYEKQGVVLIVR